MSKRKLSNQQKARIDQRQRRSVADENDLPGGQNEQNLGPECAGIITCHFGQQLDVEAQSSNREGKIYRCYQRSNLPPLVCGDRVVYQADSENSGVITALKERSSVFSRPAANGELRPVASNIELVLIVIAPVPQPFQNLVDRYLVAIESLGLTPVIVINKSDLQTTAHGTELQRLKELYTQIGYQLIQVSAHSGNGMDTLKAALENQTAVIVGQSGVGKSSLLNTLNPEIDAQVGALSANRDKGTHTTTASRLFHLDGCDLIDSPGIREFGLWHMEAQELLEGFIEFRPFTGLCKFRDCSHTSEPQCALQQAVEAGKISEHRMNSYLHIRETLSDQ